MDDSPRSDLRAARIAASRAWLDRYQPLLDDPAAFDAALAPPPPIDLLVHPGRASVDAVRGRLAARGLAVEAFGFAPDHLRVSGHAGAGTLPEVVLGLAHPQGVSSALAARALGAAPGELILDMCAAPGGKSALLALAAGDRARVVAADVSVGRCGLLVTSLARVAVSAAVVVRQDGTRFPRAAHFDAILLDAPCTGEGTFRVASPRYNPVGDDGLARSAGLQRRLLARALDLLAPGGRLVYSTCAYAPEENEEVLSAVLAGRTDIDLVPLPGPFPGVPGVSAWHGAALDARLRHARRIFPHHTGSWGFFVALLVKDGTRGAAEVPPAPPVTDIKDDAALRAALLEGLGERFGLSADDLEPYVVRERGRDVWLAARVPRDLPLGGFDVIAPGLRAVHRASFGMRITNSGLRLLGPALRRRVVDLPPGHEAAALAGQPFPAPAEAPRGGQVAVRVEGAVAAAGFVTDGQIVLEIPRGWR